MEYVQVFVDDEVEIPIGDTTPKVVEAELKDIGAVYRFCADLLEQLRDLGEEKVLIIRKVIY